MMLIQFAISFGPRIIGLSYYEKAYLKAGNPFQPFLVYCLPHTSPCCRSGYTYILTVCFFGRLLRSRLSQWLFLTKPLILLSPTFGLPLRCRFPCETWGRVYADGCLEGYI